MVAFTATLVAAAHLLALAALTVVRVAAMPSFESVTSWSSIGNLVPGMSFLEGLGPATTQDLPGHVPYYVSIAATRGNSISTVDHSLQRDGLTSHTGNPGNATMRRNRSPPLFYIHQNQLWHYHNESAIMPVNVHNISDTAPPSVAAAAGSQQLPLQLVVGDRTGGVSGGRWRWQGTRLFYENGEQTNQGLFYSCADVNGLNGLFLFLQA